LALEQLAVFKQLCEKLICWRELQWCKHRCACVCSHCQLFSTLQ